MKQFRQRGFTIVEFLGVLAAIGVMIAVVVYPNLQKGRTQGNVARDSDALMQAMSDMREAFSSSATEFTGVTTSTVLKYFPASMKSGATIKTSSGNGTITVVPSTTIVTNDTLQWTVTGYDTVACDKLAGRFGDSAVAVRINGGGGYVTVKSPTTAYNAAAAVTACAHATANLLQIEFMR